MIGMYLLFMIVPMILALYTQHKVKSSYEKYSRIRNSAGLSGAEAAIQMLSAAGLSRDVRIERHDGFLSDHYDPREKVLRLSPDVYEGRSLASIGIACHEAGHAVQDAQKYGPLALRNTMVPTASIGSNLGLTLIFIGLFLTPFRGLAVVGLLLFLGVVIFSLITLPVEFDASNRAKEMLSRMGLVRGREEANGVAAMLDAAAWTYVAAAVSAIAALLYYGLMIFGGRRN